MSKRAEQGYSVRSAWRNPQTSSKHMRRAFMCYLQRIHEEQKVQHSFNPCQHLGLDVLAARISSWHRYHHGTLPEHAKGYKELPPLGDARAVARCRLQSSRAGWAQEPAEWSTARSATPATAPPASPRCGTSPIIVAATAGADPVAAAAVYVQR